MNIGNIMKMLEQISRHKLSYFLFNLFQAATTVLTSLTTCHPIVTYKTFTSSFVVFWFQVIL